MQRKLAFFVKKCGSLDFKFSAARKKIVKRIFGKILNFYFEMTKRHLTDLKTRKSKYINSCKAFLNSLKKYVQLKRHYNEQKRLLNKIYFYKLLIYKLIKTKSNPKKQLSIKFLQRVFMGRSQKKITYRKKINLILKKGLSSHLYHLKSKVFKAIAQIYKERIEFREGIIVRISQRMQPLKNFFFGKRFFSTIEKEVRWKYLQLKIQDEIRQTLISLEQSKIENKWENIPPRSCIKGESKPKVEDDKVPS